MICRVKGCGKPIVKCDLGWGHTQAPPIATHPHYPKP